MTQSVINIGITANDKSGDSLRAAFNKINLNFTELYTASSGSISLATLKEIVSASSDFDDFQSRIAEL